MNALELHQLGKSFAGISAVSDVSMALTAGEIHGLVGGNGAGKSTLIRMISGLLQPDSGVICCPSSPASQWSSQVAAAAGILTIHQEGEFFPHLSVAENIALSGSFPLRRSGLIDQAALHNRARTILAQLPQPPAADIPAEALTNTTRQLIRLAAAFAAKPALLILDEPTAALSHHETNWLLAHIRQLAAAGTTVLYVSHRLSEVLSLCHRITVLRDGRISSTQPAARLTTEMLIREMSAAEPSASSQQLRPEKCNPSQETAPESTSIRITWPGGGSRERQNILTLSPGQILAVYGLAGSGRSSLAARMLQLKEPNGLQILLGDQPLRGITPSQRIREGLSLLPEDRLTQSVFASHDVCANTIVSAQAVRSPLALTDPVRAYRRTQAVISEFSVRCNGPQQNMRSLSGGNQQKLLLGRCLLNHPRLLILDEPTRGVDAAARTELHTAIARQAAAGTAVMMITSDLEEALSHSHLIAVLEHGQLSGVFPAEETRRQAITAAAFGLPSPSDSSSQQSISVSPAAPLPASLVQLTPSARTAADPARQSSLRPHRDPRLRLLTFLVAALMLLLSITSSGFRPISVIDAAAPLGILALAAMLVIIAGGIDISIGSILAVSAAVAAHMLQLPLPVSLTIPLAFIASLTSGGCCGFLNGWLHIRFRIHSIVVTLGTLSIYRGIVILLLGRNAMTGLPPQLNLFSQHRETGFRTGILIAACVCGIVWVFLRRTPRGRSFYAVGSSPAAAHQCGLSLSSVRLRSFASGGALAGLAGFLQLATNMQMQGTLGSGYELTAIAAAVIGGVAIDGGRGTVAGAILGCLLLQLCGTALIHWGIADHHLTLLTGTMLLVAVLTDRLSRRGTAHG